jgi:nitroimidazol reductase NimA-like FMN-containing flavoprotein (pyridoxamine 5'-phosphate oxidase superfamily)
MGRLACVFGEQPYLVPFYFAFHNDYIYSFSDTGKKINWMRNNPLVCIQADEVSDAGTWTSVVASGRYEELEDTNEMQSTRTFAATLLQQRVQWWEPAAVKPGADGHASPVTPILYRIRLLEISGRRATAQGQTPSSKARSLREPAEHGWLQRLIQRLRGESRPPPF